MNKIFYWLFSFIGVLLFSGMAWSTTVDLSSTTVDLSSTTVDLSSTNNKASTNPVVEDSLEQDLCDDLAMDLALKTVQNTQLEMNKRVGALQLFFENCQNHKKFLQTVRAVALDPQLEWRIKEQALLFHQVHNKKCSNELVTHLLNIFPTPLLWSIRDAMIWVLSETKQGCDEEIIRFFARFIQEPAIHLSSELVDFRQEKIQSLIWALVRLGIKNENLSVVEELKKIAIRPGMNLYFRVRAVEALQDLSFYLESATWTLYEIIKGINKRIPSNGVTYDAQRIQYEKDTEVRDSAFSSLLDLIQKERQELLYFLLIPKEQLPDEELYRRKGFSQLPLPKYKLSASARTALTALIEDKTTPKEYRQHALLVVNKDLPE